MRLSTPLRDRLSLGPPRVEPAPDSLAHDLLNLLASVDDPSSWSDELAATTKAWPLSYFFSPARANVLRALPLPFDGLVLEIGARGGAVTRYLGEESILVDALEPDTEMATVAAARCADLPSVAVHTVWLDEVPAEPVYDLIVAIDVIGELEQRQVSLAEFVADCRARLAPDGVLVMAADNAEGVRHRSGGLTPAPGIASDRRPPRLDAAAVASAASSSGFEAQVLSAFPDHRLTKVLFDHVALSQIDAHLLEVLPSFPSPSYGAPVVEPDLEGSWWSSLVRAGRAEHSANSLVVVLSTRTPLPVPAATYWSAERAAALSACNRIRLDDGAAVVERGPAFPKAPAADGPLTLRPHVEPYVKGPSVVDCLAAAPTAREAQDLLGRWAALVHDAADRGDVSWDLIPRNVVIDAEDRLRPIDQEWALSQADAAMVLRRGAFWLARDLLAAPVRPAWLRGGTHGQVADFLLRLTGRTDDHDWLATFVAEEAHTTAHVSPLKPPRTRAHVERQNGSILSAISSSSTPSDPSSDESPDLDPGAEMRSLQGVVDSLLENNQQLRDRLAQLERERRHEALTQRDHLIGITAELEVMRDRVGSAQAAQKLAMTKVRRLRKQVADMQASATWRVGRVLVRPLARLRGRR